MKRSIDVRIVQHAPVLGDLEANLADHERRVAAAAADGVDLIVFPELSLTGYALGDLVDAVALDAGHPLWPRVVALSDAVDVVVGFVERGDEGWLHNAGAFLSGGRAVHVHRKTYLPTYGPFDEGRHFAPGGAIETFDADWGRAALVVCEELWHPGVVHGAAMLGAGALFAIANAPGRGPLDGGWESHRGWREIARTYARLYAVHVVLASRVGYEEGFVFGGASAAWAPDGSPLALAGFVEPEDLTVTLSRGAARAARVANPAHAIERPELLLDALDRARGGLPPRRLP